MEKSKRRLHNQPSMKTRRRALRNHSTPAEAALWKLLRRSQLAGRKFRRQHSVGGYVLDFYCPAERLAIELDGAFHNDPLRQTYDDRRTRFLETHGIHMVRFENRDVFEQPDAVLEAIAFHFNDSQ